MCYISLSDQKTYSLVDSGADISLISREAFDKIQFRKIRCFSTRNCVPIRSISGHRLTNFGTAVLQVKIAGFNQPFKFQIVEGLKNDCILGNDFLSAFSVQLDFGQKTMNIDDNVIPLRPQRLTCQTTTSLVRVPHKVTIPAQSYIEIPALVNRVQLLDQDCIVQPLSNAPVLGEEPGLCLIESVGHVDKNKRITVMIVNNTGRDYVLPPRSVIGIAEVLDDPETCISVVSEDDKAKAEPQNSDISEVSKVDLSHIQGSERQKLLRDMIERNADLFAKSDCDLGFTDLVKAKIDTGHHPPIKQKPYHLPYSQRKVVQEQIDEMLKAGIIEPSRSPWASPIVLVAKRDSKQRRFCVDLRKVNHVSVPYSHPLPRIDDILASLEGSQFFTCLDLKSGYWQIAMDEDSKEKTAFTCFYGLYHFLRLPFGLQSSGSYFSELMNKVLTGIQHKFTVAYLDDIIIYSKTFEEHVEHIETVFSRLRSAGLKLKMSKCEFLKQEVKYLGHLVSPSGIRPDPAKISAIQNLRPPTNVKSVRSFLGMCGFYRRFVPDFAKIAKPLTELTKKNRHFHWDDACQSSFETLRTALTVAPILAYPNVDKPYKLYTDASQNAIGAALVQETELGERVIQYLSHQLNETQRRWPTIEREAYAIVYSVQKFRPYLLGCKFTVMTDHKPLKHLFTSEMRNARIQRWAIILDEYGCDIQYISGRQNVVADALSRLDTSREDCHTEIQRNGLMTSESLPCHVDECVDTFSVNDGPCSVNVIDSDRAPDVQVETKVKRNELSETHSKEKFKEFLQGHPDLGLLQKEDPEIQRLIHILEDQNHSNHAVVSRYYILEDGLLYRVSDPSKYPSFPGLQLVIPKPLQKLIIEEIHSGYFGGHLGIDKTYDKIRSRYFWSGLYRDVVQYLKTCVACNMRKLKRERPPLQDMPIPKYPFEQIAIDTSGPYPESFQGNRYIITVIDLFSGWPESFATSSKSAETVAKILLEHIIPRHACPRIMISDNGTEFCNAVIDQITTFSNIKHIRTSVYHPQSNGKCERYNRVQNDMLAKLVSKSQRDWDTKLPSILSAYRTAKNETTKYSPFFLLYGRDPVLPLDSILSPKYRYQGEDYVPTMLENMHSAYSHVRHNLVQSHERNKFYYDRTAKPTKIKVGDMVYFRNPTEATQNTSKLSCHWKPFYRVIKTINDVTVVIKNQLSGDVKVVNVQNLRFADPDTLWENVTDEPHHINSKYESRQKSFIPVPLRVQPPRQSKFSFVDTEMHDTETSTDRPIPDSTPPNSKTTPVETYAPVKPSTSEQNYPPLPEDSDSDVDLDVPLSEMQKRWREEKSKDSSSDDENIPLSQLAKRLRTEQISDPPEIEPTPMKRPLTRSGSESDAIDEEIRSPPSKLQCADQDHESDTDGFAADSVNAEKERMSTNSSVKEALLVKMLQTHERLMTNMFKQLEKL